MIREETEDGTVGWVTWVEELPGCVSQGDTPEEATQMIREAMELWLETSIEAVIRFPNHAPSRTIAGGSSSASLPVCMASWTGRHAARARA
jgi:antitoxin HicB